MTARWHHLLEAQHAARPGALALTDSSGARWSYADLMAAAEDLGDRLRATGAGPGERVLLLAENCAASVAALFACSLIGAAVIPLNARLTEAEIARVLAHATPVAILAASAASPEAARHAARMGAQTITGAFGRLHLLARAADPEDHAEAAAILYTTGTTGPPRGVVLSHGNLRFGGRASAELRGMTPGDLVCGVLPLSHVFGLASVITAAVAAGAAVRLEARFSAERLHAALAEGVSVLSAVPQMHALLMQFVAERGLAAAPGDRLRYVSSGGAPLDPAWKRKAESFYRLPLQNGYGLTETTAGVCATRNTVGVPDISVGPALPGVEIAIDATVPGGGAGAGEVLVRGPNVMQGYFRSPGETRRALDAAGWLRTGDLGRIDADGRLHLLGRSKELIIHGGFNVYPPEVEAALNAHPQVIQSAVIGRRVAGDEEVLAFVQAADGNRPDPEALRAFVAARLAGYKRPSRIVIAASLPAAPTGKILKHRLLEVFAAELSGG